MRDAAIISNLCLWPLVCGRLVLSCTPAGHPDAAAAPLELFRRRLETSDGFKVALEQVHDCVQGASVVQVRPVQGRYVVVVELLQRPELAQRVHSDPVRSLQGAGCPVCVG